MPNIYFYDYLLSICKLNFFKYFKEKYFFILILLHTQNTI